MTDKPKPMTLRERWKELLYPPSKHQWTDSELILGAAWDHQEREAVKTFVEQALNQLDEMAAALKVAYDEMRSVRLFVTTREKRKHPEGTELFDAAIEQARAALARYEGRNE